LTLLDVYGLGLGVFGGALHVTLVAGRSEWPWMSLCAMLVLLMAAAQNGGRKPLPQESAEPRRLPDDGSVPLRLVIKPKPRRPSDDEPR
jgi:hypothetical protein